MTSRPADYVWIRKWGKMMRKSDFWIEEQVALARRENAPREVIFKRPRGTWATIEDIRARDTRKALGLFHPPSNKKPLPETDPRKARHSFSRSQRSAMRREYDSATTSDEVHALIAKYTEMYGVREA